MKDRENKAFMAYGLIIVGGLLLLGQFNIPFVRSFDLGDIISIIWPLFILVPGLNMLKERNTVWGGVLTFIGGAFLLDNILDLMNINFHIGSIFNFFWPAALIFIGYSMLKPNSTCHRNDEDNTLKDDIDFE